MLGTRNIYLIGPMGSGKTAVGKQLARILRIPFVDSDSEIEQRTGADIPLIFEKEGEAGFRQREKEVIESLTRHEPLVLATGGGAILLPENRACLKARGAVVYLETSVDQQAARVRAGHNRPLLTGTVPLEKLTELMKVRAPLYAETADLTVRTDERRVKLVADQIVSELRALSGGASPYT